MEVEIEEWNFDDLLTEMMTLGIRSEYAMANLYGIIDYLSLIESVYPDVIKEAYKEYLGPPTIDT